jgi:hypothetical protein
VARVFFAADAAEELIQIVQNLHHGDLYYLLPVWHGVFRDFRFRVQATYQAIDRSVAIRNQRPNRKKRSRSYAKAGSGPARWNKHG